MYWIVSVCTHDIGRGWPHLGLAVRVRKCFLRGHRGPTRTGRSSRDTAGQSGALPPAVTLTCDGPVIWGYARLVRVFDTVTRRSTDKYIYSPSQVDGPYWIQLGFARAYGLPAVRILLAPLAEAVNYRHLRDHGMAVVSWLPMLPVVRGPNYGVIGMVSVARMLQ